MDVAGVVTSRTETRKQTTSGARGTMSTTLVIAEYDIVTGTAPSTGHVLHRRESSASKRMPGRRFHSQAP